MSSISLSSNLSSLSNNSSSETKETKVQSETIKASSSQVQDEVFIEMIKMINSPKSNKHPHVLTLTSNLVNHYCDVCQVTLTTSLRCVPCNWDVCSSCDSAVPESKSKGSIDNIKLLHYLTDVNAKNLNLNSINAFCKMFNMKYADSDNVTQLMTIIYGSIDKSVNERSELLYPLVECGILSKDDANLNLFKMHSVESLKKYNQLVAKMYPITSSLNVIHNLIRQIHVKNATQDTVAKAYRQHLSDQLNVAIIDLKIKVKKLDVTPNDWCGSISAMEHGDKFFKCLCELNVVKFEDIEKFIKDWHLMIACQKDTSRHEGLFHLFTKSFLSY